MEISNFPASSLHPLLCGCPCWEWPSLLPTCQNLLHSSRRTQHKALLIPETLLMAPHPRPRVPTLHCTSSTLPGSPPHSLLTHLSVSLSMPWDTKFMKEGHTASAPGLACALGPGSARPCTPELARRPWEGPHGLTRGLFSPTLQQNLVWALMITIPLVTGLYILANVSYLLVLAPSEILSTDAMAVSWG